MAWSNAMSPAGVAGLDAFALARLVGCGTPDAENSDGAEYLTDVRDAVVEAFNDRVRIDGLHGFRVDRVREDIWQTGAPIDSRDHVKWRAFVDLEAYRLTAPEGIEHCYEIDDMADLYLRDIFDTLMSILTVNLEEWMDEQEEDEDDDADR